jgi:EAL and modified HD-GYP domain-containing signal transduction protein
LTDDKEIFVPITNISVFSDIAAQCDAPHDRIVLLIDNTIPPVDMYVNRLKELKEQGYKLAMRKLAVSDFESHRPILQLVDYMFLNNKKIAIDKASIYFGKLYPDIALCAGNIDNMESFEKIKEKGGYKFYEGEFYRVPITKGDNNVSLLKVNYIALLNIVNDENFELDQAAAIISRDTALTISLLKMVNNMTVNGEITSIKHAAAMLGQKELKRWINTAVAKALYTDKPSEITRVSLLRAKFAENLAGAFKLAVKKDELFLMGLFSVLDVILEKPMKEALELVQVSEDIKKALVDDTGTLAKVLDFVKEYEIAGWQEVSRIMILEEIDVDTVYKAYVDTLTWYRDAMMG